MADCKMSNASGSRSVLGIPRYRQAWFIALQRGDTSFSPWAGVKGDLITASEKQYPRKPTRVSAYLTTALTQL